MHARPRGNVKDNSEYVTNEEMRSQSPVARPNREHQYSVKDYWIGPRAGLKISTGYSLVTDKFGHAKLTPQPSDLVGSPRILECPVQMEAELMGSHEMMRDLPDRKGGVMALEVKILRVHVEDSLRLKGHENRIDTDKWHPTFMVFQEFYGMSGKLVDSELAKIDESNYRGLTRSDVVSQGAGTDEVRDNVVTNPVTDDI